MGMRLIFARAQTVFPTASLEDAASWGYDTCPEGHELLYAPASDGTRVLAAGAFVDMLCKGGGGGAARERCPTPCGASPARTTRSQASRRLGWSV